MFDVVLAEFRPQRTLAVRVEPCAPDGVLLLWSVVDGDELTAVGASERFAFGIRVWPLDFVVGFRRVLSVVSVQILLICTETVMGCPLINS